MTIVTVLSSRADPKPRKEFDLMAKRSSFVPEALNASSLEGRVVLSTFGDIGNWFSSQYHHVTDDLGITHSKKNPNAAAGIEKLQKASQKPVKPAVHSAPLVHVTSNDTVKFSK
jgi:hypothetical protein